MLYQTIVNGLMTGSIYALVALGYSLVYSVLGFMNFAHGDLLSVAVYLCLVLGRDYLGLPIALTILLSIVGTAVLSAAIGRFLLIPASRRSNVLALVVAIGASIVMQNGLIALFTSEARPFNAGASLAAPVAAWLPVKWLHMTIFFCVTGSLALLWFVFFRHSLLGLEIRASASNRKAARNLGLRRDKVFVAVFFVSGLFAALAGIAAGLDDGLVVPGIGFSLGIRAFVASVLGGVRSLSGAVAGAFVLGMLENVASLAVWSVPWLAAHSGFLPKDTIALVLIGVVLVWRKNGLFASGREPRP